MAQCEMCSKSVDNPTVVLVEGVEMKVCPACIKFGKRPAAKPVISQHMVRNAQRVFRKQTKRADVDENKYVSSDAGKLVKAAREKLGIKQIDLSRKLSIAEAEIHQVESGHMSPTLALARKFEQGLHIKLIKEFEKDDEETISGYSSGDSSGGVTIGDMIKIKKRK